MFVCRNGTWGRTGGRACAFARARARLSKSKAQTTKEQRTNNPSPPAPQPFRFVNFFLLLQFIKIIICNHVFFGKAKGGFCFS